MPVCFDAFKLPPQHLESLSFCEASPQALSDWLIQQPLGKPRQLSVLLYTLLPEINQLKCDNQQRIELLDIMRPAVYQCVASSHELHLQDPLQLNKKAMGVAMMSHALLRHLCDGYLIIIKDELSTTDESSHIAKCVFFALHGLGQLYFHCAQLYAGSTPLFWLKAHKLYQLAVEQNIADTPIPAYHSPEENRTIAQAYKRLIMLACSHSNQLPQVDIKYLYSAFEDWAAMVEITSSGNIKQTNQLLYWANLDEDAPPHNRDQHKSNNDVAFDFTEVILLLQAHNHYAPGNTVKEIPTFFRHSLAAHLLLCWQRSERRKQPRQAVDERLEICVGLENAYTLLNQASEHSLKPLMTNAIDSSPDGLCLRWQNQIPKQTAPGECVLIRSPGKKLWRIGIIRWVQRLNQYTYAGIQLLSNPVAPTAAKLNWEYEGNKQSQPSIAFADENQSDGGIDLLLVDNISNTHEAHASLVTQQGEDALLQLDKLAEFAGAHHYICKIANKPTLTQH